MTTPQAPAPPAGPTAKPSAHRARRPRLTLMIVLFLITVALLLGAADWLARTAAQNQLADQIQQHTDGSTPPTVTIGGTLFLPQVLRGRYDQVAITFPEVSDGPLRLRDVYAALSGVHVPFRDILTEAQNPILVDHADEQAFLTYDDLNSYLAAVGQPVTVHGDGAGTVLLTGSVQLGTSTVTGTAQARITAAGDAVAVTPTRLVSDSPLAAVSEVLLGERFTFLIPLDPLPFGEQVTDIQVQEHGFLIRAQGDNLLVTP